MPEIIGIPTNLLFTIIIVLIGAVYRNDKKKFDEKFEAIDKDIKSFDSKLEKNSKSLSKDELKEVKDLIIETVINTLNSREVRDDLVKTIKDTMLHIESNRSKSQAAIYCSIEEELERKLEEKINRKFSSSNG